MEDTLRKIVKRIAIDLGDEFDRNFERQKFFTEPWQRRKSPVRSEGRAILTDTSRLRKSIKKQVAAGTVSFTSDLPYAPIHNEGGEIVVTEKMKRFFRAKFYEVQKPFGRKEKEKPTRSRALTDAGFYAWTATMTMKNAEAEFWRALALKKAGSVIKIPRRRFIGYHAEIDRIIQNAIDATLPQDIVAKLTPEK